MKIYRSSTGLAISVTLENGRNRYVSFDSISDGSSYCHVNDKRLMRAIEKHPYFGTLFNIYYNDEPEEAAEGDGTPAAEEPVKKSVKKAAKKSEEGVGTPEVQDPNVTPEGGAAENAAGTVANGDGTPKEEAEANETDEVKEMSFECFEDAREFLNEKYGIAKKKLMSKVMVITEAEALGIKISFND